MKNLYALFVLFPYSLLIIAVLKLPPKTYLINGDLSRVTQQTHELATLHPNSTHSAEKVANPPLSVADIQSYILKESKIYGINPVDTNWIISHESEWNPKQIGDDKICNDSRSVNYGKETESRGLWQISSCWHPEVSDQCAFSVPCSTRFSLHLLTSGMINQWSSWKYRCTWYKNQNPPNCLE